MKQTMSDVAMSLIAASDAGARYANGLRPGLLFLGAGPAAEELGYIRSTPMYYMFTGAALDVWERWKIIVNERNRIIRIDKPE